MYWLSLHCLTLMASPPLQAYFRDPLQLTHTNTFTLATIHAIVALPSLSIQQRVSQFLVFLLIKKDLKKKSALLEVAILLINGITSSFPAWPPPFYTRASRLKEYGRLRSCDKKGNGHDATDCFACSGYGGVSASTGGWYALI